MAHNTAHWAVKKTRELILTSGMTWPTLTSEVKRFANGCDVCQLCARATCFNRIPISAKPRDAEICRHWFMACVGPLLPGEQCAI